MNASMRWPSTGGELQHVLVETKRVAAPSAADRERITDALRARLGAVVLPEGLVPDAPAAAAASSGSSTAAAGGMTASQANGSAARAGLGTGGWVSIVVGTGVVAGALGFVLGHGMAEREPGASIDESATVAATAPVLHAPTDAASGSGPARAERSGASGAVEGASTSSEAQTETKASRRRSLATERSARVQRRASVERAGDAAPVERGGSPAPEPRGLSFAEVLERVQRANVALRQGQAALALIQLAELDRGAGEVLREERDATRVLALCAIGDTAGARRAAAPLLSGLASSIYAPRLDSSCAREDERMGE
jgi:hypothetical protein